MRTRLYLWKGAPALRLLLPLVLGIAAQWYLGFQLPLIATVAAAMAVLLLLGAALPVAVQYILQPFYGLLLMLLLAAAGAAVVWLNTVTNHQEWMGHCYTPGLPVLLQLDEPPVEKRASYKAAALVKAVRGPGGWQPAKGKTIIYFKKEARFAVLDYGAQLVTTQPLQPIQNSGNPGAFDYRRYSFFQGITHQVYIPQAALVPSKGGSSLQAFVFRTRAWVLATLRRYITRPAELGLAEALLIGYKDDLDKALLQAYSNTGVVHVIAISGLHLGIIYAILMWLTKPLQRKKLLWLRVLLIVSFLWLFTLLAGAQASVVRSAVMFTVLALGTLLHRKGNIYNTLALSALILLLANPFWLWDAGFQLSYAAVLSIIVFYRPIYNWLFFQNKGLDAVWQLMSVTLAAQILTIPFTLYYFHQFPLLFFITNAVAVPLSTLILIGEILLCAFAWLPAVAQPLGRLLQYLIYIMNTHIQDMDRLPFAAWQNLSLSFWQAALLMGVIGGAGYWLLQKEKRAFLFSAICLFVFVTLRTHSFWQTGRQQKIIVYNIPRRQAVDVLQGRKLWFWGDAVVEADQSLYNFHISPSRIVHRAQPSRKMFEKAFAINGKKIAIIDTTLSFGQKQKQTIDLLILSKNPKLYVAQLHKAFNVKLLVIDASVPPWKARLWQRDCDSLKIACYNVAEKGAFVMNL